MRLGLGLIPLESGRRAVEARHQNTAINQTNPSFLSFFPYLDGWLQKGSPPAAGTREICLVRGCSDNVDRCIASSWRVISSPPGTPVLCKTVKHNSERRWSAHRPSLAIMSKKADFIVKPILCTPTVGVCSTVNLSSGNMIFFIQKLGWKRTDIM